MSNQDDYKQTSKPLDKKAYIEAAEAVAPILRKEGKVDNPTSLADSAGLPSVIELMVTIKEYWTTPYNEEPKLKEFAQYVQDLMRQRDKALLQKIEEAGPKKETTTNTRYSKAQALAGRIDELKELEKVFVSKGGGVPTHLRSRLQQLRASQRQLLGQEDES